MNNSHQFNRTMGFGSDENSAYVAKEVFTLSRDDITRRLKTVEDTISTINKNVSDIESNVSSIESNYAKEKDISDLKSTVNSMFYKHLLSCIGLVIAAIGATATIIKNFC